MLGIDSSSENVTSKSLHVISSENVTLRTKLFKGFLGSGHLSAIFAHGLDAEKIWSVNVLVKNPYSDWEPPNYPTDFKPNLDYSFFYTGAHFNIMVRLPSILAGSPYRVAITYQV